MLLMCDLLGKQTTLAGVRLSDVSMTEGLPSAADSFRSQHLEETFDRTCVRR
jgi:hypothetical protein